MSGDWQVATLGELCSMRYGKLLPKTSLSDIGYPVWSGYSVVGYHDEFMFEEPEVSITCRGVGGTGDIHMTPPKSWVTNLAIVIRPLSTAGIRKDFLYWAMKATDRRNLITGSAQSQITIDHLKHHRVRFPGEDEQRAIAGVLGALDDKIEQNRRTARALERLARAIFRAWFVDFEPVKAKADGATAFPSMPQPIFDALPTRFVNSDIGAVPEGWEVKPLGEVVQLTMGQSPKSEFYNQKGKGLPFHQGVSDHSFRFPTRRVYCTVEGRIAEEGDILLSVRAPVGRINVADVRMVLGRGLAGMRHLSGRQSLLLYQMQHLFAEDDAVGDGTIYKSVNKKYLQAMPLLAASTDAEEAFERIARPMDKLISSVVLESRKLAELRDYLLPKLLSGAVRVKEAERALETAL
jgi:type I restriction enzyme S subunit